MDPSPRLSALQALHRLASSSVESLAWNSKVTINTLPRKATAPLLDQMLANGSDRQAGMLSYIRCALHAAFRPNATVGYNQIPSRFYTLKISRVKEASGYGN